MSGSWHGGKGDRVRPVNRKKYAEGYGRVFSKCKHRGCKNHISHPCEKCGYLGDK